VAKREHPLDVARRADAQLPTFPDHPRAQAAFFELMAAKRDRLKAVLLAGGGPPFGTTPDDLLAIDRWVSSLTERDFIRMGSSLNEVDLLVAWHAASVAAAHAPHAHWIVEESDSVVGHWRVGIRQGLGTFALPLQYASGTPLRWPRGKRGTPHYRWFKGLVSSVSTDPTLHPRVVANQERLSGDFGLRSCQCSVLSHDIDAFDERALREALRDAPNYKVPQRLLPRRPGRTRDMSEHHHFHMWQIVLVRCLEVFEQVGDDTVDVLGQVVRDEARVGRIFALALLIRHRRDLGLRMASEYPQILRRYGAWPLIEACAPLSEPGAIEILARSVELITKSNHSLWQEAEEFVTAVRALWGHARNGNAEAQRALRMVGRRWRRIPNETLMLMRRRIPGFTLEEARSGARATEPGKQASARGSHRSR
jgi:hypothetical protein